MRIGLRRISRRTRTNPMAFFATVLMIGVLSGPAAYGQARADTRPAEQVFKNVQSLKGIPADEFMSTMGFFSASLGISCGDCHTAESGGDWAKYADDNDRKRRARGMIAMVNTMNKNFFAGRRVLTCYTCHRGSTTPETTPDLTQFYATLRYREPDRMVDPFPGAPEAEQVLDKYLQAIGGAQKAAALISLAAKGTFQTYGIPTKYALELFAKAPAQRTVIVHNLADGELIDTFDGREAWIVQPAQLTPVPLLERTGGEIDGAKLTAALTFPGQIKKLLTQWRVGPPAVIDDRDLTMVQGTINGKFPVNLYFDDESGLLARTVTYADSPVGLAPMQVDYADYHELAGVKVPYKMIVTWLDGRSTIQLTEVQANAAIDASKFARPGR
jgi:photosynthetic reaction center cytochrome c subunit